MYITKPSSPLVTSAIEAIDMRHYLQFVYSSERLAVERRSLEWERQHRGDCHQEDTTYVIRNVSRWIQESEVVLWDVDLMNAAVSGSGIFRGLIPDRTLYMPDGKQAIKPQLWFLVSGIWESLVAEGTSSMARLIAPCVSTYRLSREGEFMAIIDLKFNEDGPLVEFACCWLGQPIDESSESLVALLEFMRQPITVKEVTPTTRQYRRAAERHSITLPSVYTIRLRRSSTGDHRLSGETLRNYSCQWLVGAHWRNQYYPSEGKHKPVYILPYVKGDPSKPFKSPGEKVYAVVR